MSKTTRLEQLELLLKANPEGLHRSEIARRLRVHRSTAGRYIIELGEKTMLWENNFRVGIIDRRSTPHSSFSLAENFSLQMSIQTIYRQIDHHNIHLITATRKLALAMKSHHPVTSAKMLKIAEVMDNIPNNGTRDMAADFEQLAEAIENKNYLNFKFSEGNHKVRIIPEDFTIDNSVPLSRALRISGTCSVTGKRCSLFLHTVEILKETEQEDILLECPFNKEETSNKIHLKLRIFNTDIMDSFSSITDHSFQIEKLTDGTSTVRLLIPFQENLIEKLLQMGPDLEVLYPEDIRNNFKKKISLLNKRYRDTVEKKSYFREDDSFTSIRIREINHRIKNQLVSITSLINLYSNKSSDKSHITILDEVNSKITAISMVHDMLTTCNSWPILPVKDYIKELCLTLINSMETFREIEFHEDIIEIYLPENQITIIGLIVSELCINSLKHAFTGKSNGKISVILTIKNEVKTLCFKDDGKGMGKNHNNTLAEGTGHNLVNIFVEELGGSINYLSEQGTEIVITFI